MVTRSSSRRRRLHRHQLRPLRRSRRHAGLARHDARQADVRRPAGEPADVMDSPRHRFVRGDIADAAVAAPLVRGRGHRRPLRGRDARRPVDPGGRRLHPDRRRRHVRAARGRARSARTCGASSRSRPTRSTAASPTGASTETDELHPRNPYAASKAGARPPRLQLLGHLRRAGRHHARVEQLRAVPVPREGHPALRHQRDRRPAAAALRRRPERARLAPRRRPLPRPRPADRARASRARSTTSAAATKWRTSTSPTGFWSWSASPATLITPVADRPGPRSPLRARHDEARAPRVAAGGAVRRRPGRHGGVVPRERSVVAAGGPPAGAGLIG